MQRRNSMMQPFLFSVQILHDQTSLERFLVQYDVAKTACLIFLFLFLFLILAIAYVISGFKPPTLKVKFI